MCWVFAAAATRFLRLHAAGMPRHAQRQHQRQLPQLQHRCTAATRRATGQCALDPKGSQSPGECIATCKSSQAAQLQRGGGPVQVCRTAQLWPAERHDIVRSGHLGGATCDMCCKKYIKAPGGCGNQTNLPTHVPTPIMLSCNAATGQCVLDPKGSQSPGEYIATCKSQAVQLQRGGGPVCAGPKRITVSRRVHRHLQVCRTAQLWPPERHGIVRRGHLGVQRV
jgi:hypothetical protein